VICLRGDQNCLASVHNPWLVADSLEKSSEFSSTLVRQLVIPTRRPAINDVVWILPALSQPSLVKQRVKDRIENA
jgi:hypothetical protein